MKMLKNLSADFWLFRGTSGTKYKEWPFLEHEEVTASRMQLWHSFIGTFPLVVVSIERLEQNTGWQSNHRQITNLHQTTGKHKTQNKHYIKENLWNNVLAKKFK